MVANTRRVVAFGCSYTRGTALDDVWDFEKKCSIYPEPSKHAWPQLIADHLNVNCINLGKGGASNKLIWHTVMNFDFKYGDLIFVHWSFRDRYHFFEDANTGYEIDHREVGPKDRAFFEHLHSDYDMLQDMYMRINHVDSHLISKNRIHLQIEPTTAPDWNRVKTKDIYLNSFKELYPRANDGSHPGMLAHKEFSVQLLKTLGY